MGLEAKPLTTGEHKLVLEEKLRRLRWRWPGVVTKLLWAVFAMWLVAVGVTAAIWGRTDLSLAVKAAILIGAALGGALAVSTLVGGRWRAVLRQMAEVAEGAAWGKLYLRLEVRRGDEFGLAAWALNRLLKGVGQGVRLIGEASQEVRTAAGNLREYVGSVYERLKEARDFAARITQKAERQSGAVAQAAATVEETSASMEEVASAVQAINSAAQEAAHAGKEGRTTVERLQREMGELHPSSAA